MSSAVGGDTGYHNLLEPGYSTAWRTGAQVAHVSIVVVSTLVV